MTITVTITDPVSPALAQFGGQAPNLLDRVLRGTGNQFRGYVRNSYLSGQALGVRTGKTKRDVRLRKIRGAQAYLVTSRIANIFQGGAVIVPKRPGGYLRFTTRGTTSGFTLSSRWAGDRVVATGLVFTRRPVLLRPRPYLEHAATTFPWEGAVDTATEAEVTKEVRKAGLQ